MSADAAELQRRLRAALAAMHAGPTPERQQWLTVQLAAATLHLPVKLDGEGAPAPGSVIGRASLPPGTTVGMVLIPDEQQRPMLPLFSAPEEAAALIRQGCCLLRMPPGSAWSLVLGQEAIRAAVIDPDGAGWLLDREAVAWLHGHGQEAAPLAAGDIPSL